MKEKLETLNLILAEEKKMSKLNFVLSLLVALLSGVIVGFLLCPKRQKSSYFGCYNGNDCTSSCGDDACDCAGGFCCEDCDEERCCGEDHYCGKEVCCCEEDWDDEDAEEVKEESQADDKEYIKIS